MRKEEGLAIGERMTTDPVSIRAEATVGDALILMFEREVRHLPVLEGKKLAGIVSDRDIRQFLWKTGLPRESREEEERYLKLPVREVMSPNPITVSPESPIGKGVAIMVEKKIGALPVIDRLGQLVGIFTELDALRYCLYLIDRYHAG
jgi:acetoin utilization protein AcuB